MLEQKYFEDFSIGDRFESPSKTLTDAHFMFFAGMTGDAHPIHYDVHFAANTIFGKPSAHGLLLASMTALGANELQLFVHDSMIAMLSESMTFKKPAFVGTTVHPYLEVAKLKPSSKGGILTLRAWLEDHNGEVLVDGEHVYLVRSRP